MGLMFLLRLLCLALLVTLKCGFMSCWRERSKICFFGSQPVFHLFSNVSVGVARNSAKRGSWVLERRAELDFEQQLVA